MGLWGSQVQILPPGPSLCRGPALFHVEHIRVRGLVQGVGFRPHVYRLARQLNCQGDVLNDGDGVFIRLWAPDASSAETFCQRLSAERPPLSRIDAIERRVVIDGDPPPEGEFHIRPSQATAVHTGLVPDAATCPACAAELRDPTNRRYRYPFTNCTHCGPRLSIVRAIPYDRANTSMACFPMCPACLAEYSDPANRRFHAQPNACPRCGPRLWLEDASGVLLDPASLAAEDASGAASALLAQGKILAIKGIGGFHLACDATQSDAVRRLRAVKARDAKPFALMARDTDIIRRYCLLSAAEQELIASPAAPIVLLTPRAGALPQQPRLAPGIAPGQASLGFMLPYSPVHQLLLADWERPVVMTSGNRHGEPQVIANDAARARLSGLADALLLHDREILNRLDDSLARVENAQPRLLRRARGSAPAPLAVPEGFAHAPQVLALGGELKNTFCLLDGPRLILSQHMGDLGEPDTLRAFAHSIDLYLRLFQHHPQAIAIDRHPGYHASAHGRALAKTLAVPVIAVQHHHAHLAAVLGENRWPSDAPAVIGLTLDGLGYGADGSLWGGELLRAHYGDFTRLAWLRPTPLPGGDRAALEPWRNLVAQLHAAFGWENARARWPLIERLPGLADAPIPALLRSIDHGTQAPLCSSTGRLFDAVAAVLGIHPAQVAYEGQAAMELEALAACEAQTGGYPFGEQRTEAGILLDPAPLWHSLLDDLARGTCRARIAARFHAGLADALAHLGCSLARAQGLDTLALSGGSFQNRILSASLTARAENAGLRVLRHRQVPSNDGGLALGQALIAAATLATHPRLCDTGTTKRAQQRC